MCGYRSYLNFSIPGPPIDHYIMSKSDYQYIMYNAKPEYMLHITWSTGEICVLFDVCEKTGWSSYFAIERSTIVK